MSAQLDATRVYATLNGTRTDITTYVIDRMHLQWGIDDNDPVDLLAGSGEWKFTLNNDAGVQFLPDAAGALAGWNKGTMVELELAYDGEAYVRFRGYVEKTTPGAGFDGHRLVYVTALDWLGFYAGKHPIVNPGVLTDQRGDDVIRTVLALMPNPPAATELDTGVSLFPATFDTVTSKTTAYDEFSKVTRSEPGRIYLKKDRVYGETLVFENNQHWSGLRALSIIPVPASASDTLVQEDSDGLLQEDGDTILVNEAQAFEFDEWTMDEEVEHGETVINRFTISAEPRSVDASAVVLFTLNEPILIGSGQTIDIRGTYADPAGGLPINANPDDMITPVITTDYLVNRASDGSGTNISADLVLVEIVYGTEGFTHRVTNGSIYAGYVTKWSPRGKGIYRYNPIEHVETDLASIASALGTQPESLTMPYQTELIQGTLFGRSAVFEFSQPQQILKAIYFNPNTSAELMMGFLTGDVGSYFPVTVASKNINGLYIVLGVEFTLDPGGFLMCKWIVLLLRTLLLGLTQIAVEFDSGDAVDFGYLPHISSDANRTSRSFSAWIYYTTAPPVDLTIYTIYSTYGDLNGFIIGARNPNRIVLYSNRYTAGARWYTPNNSLSTSAWHHIVVTFDEQDTSSNPIIYIDGVSQTLTEDLSPSGTAASEEGQSLMIGNVKTSVPSYSYSQSFVGKIKDARVYNRILSGAEVTTLYNSGTPDADLVTDGLVFRAFAVKTKNLADYIDQTLDETLKVVDDIFRMVGIPYGSPVGRDF